MNKIGLTLLLVWLAVRAIAADYSYDRNVPYRGNAGDEYTSKMCRLDIAYQPDVQNAPVVVWFHGYFCSQCRIEGGIASKIQHSSFNNKH